MIYYQLFIEFFKTGLFSFGGGYATIPFLLHISKMYNWYSLEELKQMIGIASITPGPIGLNMATFAGLKTAGIFGALLATTSEILPSLLLVIILGKILRKHKDNFYIRALITSLKPISCALLCSVAINMLINIKSDYIALCTLTILFLISLKLKKNPLHYILISAILALILY